MTTALWIAMLAACSGGSGKDATTDTGAGPTGTTTPAAADWCRVQSVFRSRCELCHSPGNVQGDLDLQTDGYAAIVGVTSAAFGDVLVAPGDPEGSLLYRKMAGTQAADEGEPMPPTGLVSADTLQVVHDWIADGASQACDGGPTTPTTPTGQVHPPGWEDPGAHGLATKLQTDGDCRDCHGADLQGGTADVSCDSCHVADWDTTCTYCHGGELDQTGAPPQDIDDTADPEQISFAPHHEHVAGARHLAVDCDGCHVVPTDALTPGHLFDDPTAGQAEVDLSGGLSPAGTYAGGTCSDLYCHGNGRTTGTISVDDGRRTCESCHTTGGLGGRHQDHLGEGIDCEECHPDVNATGISDPDLHVNGAIEVEPEGTVTFDGDSCSGSCHFENHSNESW